MADIKVTYVSASIRYFPGSISVNVCCSSTDQGVILE